MKANTESAGGSPGLLALQAALTLCARRCHCVRRKPRFSTIQNDHRDVVKLWLREIDRQAQNETERKLKNDKRVPNVKPVTTFISINFELCVSRGNKNIFRESEKKKSSLMCIIFRPGWIFVGVFHGKQDFMISSILLRMHSNLIFQKGLCIPIAESLLP